MATIDQQFVEYIVKNLVNNPDKVSVDRKIDEKGVLLSLTVDPEDVGRVIGRKGITAQSLRVLLRALGTKQDARFNLKIVNTDDEEGESVSQAKKAETVSEPEDEEAEEAEEEISEEVEEDDEEEEEEEDEEEEDEEEEDDDEEEESEEESETSELAEKTRAELADLDDLDI